jgi:hypothetical protein
MGLNVSAGQFRLIEQATQVSVQSRQNTSLSVWSTAGGAPA